MANKQSFEELIRSEKPVLIDFFATWCGPCQMMQPVLQELAGRMGDRVRIIKIDVDKNPRAAAAWQVQGVPTLMVFQGGELRWRQSGVVTTRQLEQVIDRIAPVS